MTRKREFERKKELMRDSASMNEKDGEMQELASQKRHCNFCNLKKGAISRQMQVFARAEVQYEAD